MSRQKTVFSNSQLAHVWAQQTQSDGRNSNGSLYFNGTEIWSYGSHYRAAQIHTVKGKKLALVNSRGYSPTTGQHLSDIRNALSGLMPYFHASDVSDLKTASKELDAKAEESIQLALKRLKITSKESIKYEFESIHERFKEATQFRKLMGRAEIWPSKKDLAAVQKHLDARLARFKELNTPEMLAKRILDAEKRELNKAKLAEKKAQELIAKFYSGENVQLRDLPFERLRIQGDVVRTSRGAEVPLTDAKRLFQAIISGHDVRGANVGSFVVSDVFHVDGDTLIQIGCHKILLSEATKTLGGVQ